MDWLYSNPAAAGLQPQRLKHYRAFAFSAYGRKPTKGGQVQATRYAGGR
jgi:hypothetical protein